MKLSSWIGLGLVLLPWWAPAATASESSRVCRFTIPKLVDGRYDLEVVLFHRDGAFHNGYALVPARDNLVHSVDVTPSPPIQWQTADGKPIAVPEEMRGYYSYTRKEMFASWKKRFEQGQIKVGHPIPTPPIAWDGKELRGIVDVLIKPVDRGTQPGRRSGDVPWRIEVHARGRGNSDRLSGRYTAWTYAEKDDDYGAENPRIRGELRHACWDRDYWKAAPGTEFAPGRNWPQARGPNLTGAALPCAQPLIDNLHDARLVWVSEEILPGGRGAVLSRGGFAMYPYAWQNIGFGGFAGPAVADGRVYQFLSIADEKRVAQDETIQKNVYVQLGADPRTLANERGHMRDSVLCLDARTGRTLWWWRSEQTFRKVPSGKGGVGTTVCVDGPRLFARGSGGLYCLDARTGNLLWHQRGGRRGSVKVSYGLGGSWSHDMSPVLIGGVLVMACGKDESLAGVNAEDGTLRWVHHHACGYNAVPTKVTLEGKDYIVVGSDETQELRLIEPDSGKVLWTSDALGGNSASLCVWNDMVCGNGTRFAPGQKRDDKKGQRRAAAVRVSLKGARLLWRSDQAGYPPHRSVPVAHQGCFYIDDREHFWCLDAATGRVLGRQPHIYDMTGGSHNWVWTIASNDRILTSGLLMFSLGPAGFERLLGRLSLPLADGYMCPIKPALADGRIFMRLGDKLVCYDLRRQPDRTSRIVQLKARQAYTSSLDPENAVDLKVRVVNDRVERIYTSWPELIGPEADQVNPWIGGSQHALLWPSYPADGLGLGPDRLSGTARVRLGWHYELWTLDARRREGGLAGTFTRAVPAIANPIEVGGSVTGKVVRANGASVCVLTLQNAGSQLRKKDELRPVTLVLVRQSGGLRAWGTGLNATAHEVDPGRVEWQPNRLRGEVTVLFHDDAHFHLNQQHQTAVAAVYAIEVSIEGGRIQGSYTGRFGIAWQREGPIVDRGS